MYGVDGAVGNLLSILTTAHAEPDVVHPMNLFMCVYTMMTHGYNRLASIICPCIPNTHFTMKVVERSDVQYRMVDSGYRFVAYTASPRSPEEAFQNLGKFVFEIWLSVRSCSRHNKTTGDPSPLLPTSSCGRVTAGIASALEYGRQGRILKLLVRMCRSTKYSLNGKE